MLKLTGRRATSGTQDRIRRPVNIILLKEGTDMREYILEAEDFQDVEFEVVKEWAVI